MNLHGSTILILGGSGLVGRAVGAAAAGLAAPGGSSSSR